MMRTISSGLAAVLLLCSAAQAADYTGKYANAQITLELTRAGDAYSGTITIAGKPYPATGAEQGGRLVGQFEVQGSKFEFTAALDGANLKLSSGGREHVLTKNAPATPPPANPLDEIVAPPPPPAVPSNDPTAAPTPTPVPGAPNPPPAAPPTTPPAAPPPTPAPAPPAAPATGDQVAARLRALPKGIDNPNREWTVLVYLNADNDLEPFGIQDLNEMEKGLSGTNVEVIVLIDRCEGFDKTEGDWQGARLYRVTPDSNMTAIASEQLLDLGEINMGDQEVLAGFVEGALKAYPARQTALVMWNHGGGWASMSNDFLAPGKDKGDDVKLHELRGALETALPKAGLKKLSIIGFDMCLMAQIETATELADVGEVMIASQAIEPGFGWPYDVVIPAFTKGTAGARRIGTDIVTAFNDFYKARREKITTLSAIDLSLVGEFNTKLNAVLDKYQPTMKDNWPTLARAIFYGEQYCDRTDYRNGKTALATFDILDIAKRLKYATPGFPSDNEYREFMAVADRFVIMSANSDRHRLSNGIAVYAPVHAEMLNPDYQGTRFAQVSKWPALMASMHAQQKQDTAPPVFSEVRLTDTEDKPVPAVKPLAGHRYQLSLTGKNIIYTHAWTGQRNPQAGGLVLDAKSFVMDAEWILRIDQAKQAAHEIDVVMPQYKDGENRLKDDIPGIGLVLSNGQETATCTIDGSDLGSTDSWRIRALLEHPQLGEKPVMAVILFDNSFFEAVKIIAMMPQPDGTTRPRAIEPTPDLKVYPLHEVVADNGEIKLHNFKPLTWNKGLTFMVTTLKPGQYEAILTAETMSGVTASKRATFAVENDPDLDRANQTWQFYRPDMMVGTWDAGLRFPNEVKAMWKITVTATKQPDIFQAQIDVLTDNTKMNALIMVDRRGLPHLRIIEVEEDGRPGGAILGPALFDMTQDGHPMLLVKMVNLSGINTVWKRRETTTVQGGPVPGPGPGPMENEERLQPVEVPDPRPVQMQQPQQQQQQPWGGNNQDW